MGLDMYAFAVSKKDAGDRQTDIEAEGEELAYWRKFNHLHGWMEELYCRKGGQREFNCTTVRLELEDLDELKSRLDAGDLEHKGGFFFGGPEIYPEDFAETYAFIEKARQAIKDGKVVLYDSWW